MFEMYTLKDKRNLNLKGIKIKPVTKVCLGLAPIKNVLTTSLARIQTHTYVRPFFYIKGRTYIRRRNYLGPRSAGRREIRTETHPQNALRAGMPVRQEEPRLCLQSSTDSSTTCFYHAGSRVLFIITGELGEHSSFFVSSMFYSINN